MIGALRVKGHVMFDCIDPECNYNYKWYKCLTFFTRKKLTSRSTLFASILILTNKQIFSYVVILLAF